MYLGAKEQRTVVSSLCSPFALYIPHLEMKPATGNTNR